MSNTTGATSELLFMFVFTLSKILKPYNKPDPLVRRLSNTLVKHLYHAHP